MRLNKYVKYEKLSFTKRKTPLRTFINTFNKIIFISSFSTRINQRSEFHEIRLKRNSGFITHQQPQPPWRLEPRLNEVRTKTTMKHIQNSLKMYNSS
jgi:hypothetical protein